MALTSASSDGTLLWACANCSANLTAKVSDSSVRWIDPLTVQLPACTHCGASCSVKAIFSSTELQAPNASIPEQQSTVENPSIAANQALAQLLQSVGKLPPTN